MGSLPKDYSLKGRELWAGNRVVVQFGLRIMTVKEETLRYASKKATLRMTKSRIGQIALLPDLRFFAVSVLHARRESFAVLP